MINVKKIIISLYYYLNKYTLSFARTLFLTGSLQPFVLLNSTGSSGEDAVVRYCPGQTFQVAKLYSELQAAAAQDEDVLLQPYLSSWDELIKFMEALGPMVGLISQEIESKTSIIRQLALHESEKEEIARRGEEGESLLLVPEGGAYHSVHTMINWELSHGLVDFHTQTDSGCRTLLRLHRALLWLELFLQRLAETPAPPARMKRPSDLCKEAYQVTLAHHHTWLVQRGAELAFLAMPERGFFYQLVCVQNQQEVSLVLNTVVQAIREVYNRTQRALEEHSMLDLP
uniref:Glycolipid transfer protein domain-containing protein n=1 Tax=Denticeps clupeoides TaxID=299321 RepID=A0AAY4EN61_9TELE